MRLVAIPEFGDEVRQLSRQSPAEVLSIDGRAMGTAWTVRLCWPGQHSLAGTRQAIEESLELIENEMSHYRPGSDLERFNAARGGRWVDSPPGLFRVIQMATEIALETGGAFDPAIGRLVDLWGFGPKPRRDAPPDEVEIMEGLFNGGWSRLLLDKPRRRIWQPGGVSLNLSSIAKGFAVDQIAGLLDALGCSSYLVEIGGELRSRGLKPSGQPWWVAIEQPPDSSGFPEVAVALFGQAIATSGGYRRRFIHEGRTYSHTIDPRTGHPASEGVVSVTVIHEECARADAYSTALLVMGAEAGLAFAEQRGLAAFFVRTTPAGFEHRCSTGFQKMLA